MSRKWKYVWEKIGIPFGIWIITSIIGQGVKKYGDISMLKSLFQTFVIELWPIWFGAVCVVLYLIVRVLMVNTKQHELPNQAEINKPFSDRINQLEAAINDLQKWVAPFKHRDNKGSYFDLKGKIQRYIRDELEKYDITIKK